MSRGFFTFAQGDQYVRMAYALALSLKVSQSKHDKLSIGITEGYKVPEEYVWAFDKIIEIPWGDDADGRTWKLHNEWKSIYMTPYDETIKLDADMLFTVDITKWWDELDRQDAVMCKDVVNFRHELVTNDYYRKVFTDNLLHNSYSAFFYFKKTEWTFNFFKYIEMWFKNWKLMSEMFFQPKTRPAELSTDVIFGVASKVMEIESIKKSIFNPTFVHMKTELQNWNSEETVIPEEWVDHVPVFFNNDCELYIGNFKQNYPVHYHDKSFLTDDIIKTLERKVKR